MKQFKNLILLIPIIIIVTFCEVKSEQTNLADSLTTLNTELLRLFPRWIICDEDLSFRIYQAFLHLQYPKEKLNEQKIEVLASPRKEGYPFEILLISSGECNLNSAQIDDHMSELADFITGVRPFDLNNKGKDIRKYCYIEIAPEQPVTPTQAYMIMSYYQPPNVTQAISISLFEQSLKIGNTGYWFISRLGTDPVGYPFWSSGESKFLLRIPLGNENLNEDTKREIPYFIHATLGYDYRTTAGLEQNKTSILSWVSSRQLNTGLGGKAIGGIEYILPQMPSLGFHLNVELPMKVNNNQSIDPKDYWFQYRTDVYDPDSGFGASVVPILRGTGQLTAFYNIWLKENRLPYHYFRLEAGINYTEVKEYAMKSGTNGIFITNDNIEGLKTYKNNEFGDWVYLKAEYRNQGLNPFGLSIQYSNQIMLASGFVKILGDWLFLEGKYATPLRGVRPYEFSSFFMISPVIRITLNETKKSGVDNTPN